MANIAPLSGWMLDRVIEIDVTHPGFAGYVFRASAERRQVTAAFLAVMDLEDEAKKEAAPFLMECGHNAILEMAFEYVPAGLRSALGRSGSQVHDPDYYRQLWAVLTRGPQQIVTAIRHSAKLNAERLAIITSLPADLSDHRISVKITDKAHDIVLAVDLLERRGLDRAAIVEALCQSTKLSETIKRWSLRIPFPRGPISASEHYRPVNNGVELAATAKRYRNCSRRYFTALLEADHAFGEFEQDGQKVLISFDRSKGYWSVDGVYGYRNGDVPTGLSEAAYAFAARHGVLTRRATDRGDKPMEALRRLSRHYMDWDD